jgi:2-methylcitrate dehydratase PrpD
VNTTTAGNSVFYAVARTLAQGRLGLADFTPRAVTEPPALVDFMTYSLEQPIGSAAIIEIELRDGRTRTATVDAESGGLAAAMSDDDLVRKFIDCAQFAVRPVDAQRMVEIVLNLDRQPDIELLLAV